MGKHLLAVFLHRHQILQRVDAGLHTGGNDAGEDTGDVRTMLRGIEEGVFTLPNRRKRSLVGVLSS